MPPIRPPRAAVGTGPTRSTPTPPAGPRKPEFGQTRLPRCWAGRRAGSGVRAQQLHASPGQRRLTRHHRPRRRMLKLQPPRVQKHPVELRRPARQLAVLLEVAVLRVANDGVAGLLKVDADLVGAAGLDGHVQQAELRRPLHDLDEADRALGLVLIRRTRPHPALAVAADELHQRHVDDLELGRPVAPDERGIGLAGLALTQLVLQRRQRAALLGDHQQARGFLVQPVHQFQELGGRPRAAQGLDDAVADAGTAMHRDAGRLVDDQKMLVLEHDRKLARRCGRGSGLLGHAHRRNAHLIAEFQPRVGLGPALVDPHFASPNDAIDMGLGHALELTQQEVVQALPGRALVDDDMANRRPNPGYVRTHGGA
mmetsp:Transcript_45465/g.107315  ORF Transcript_45465/g.107315 Transcript_45465/m.107315 type:complete len:369 (+) Transcript_45465:1988-3094(+)